MSERTYKATGVNLKTIPLGESDRLLTILTREHGLIQAVAPGARKGGTTFSRLSNIFAVNDLLIAKGRSLDKVIQAQALELHLGLGQNLGKLAAGQYLAEIVLVQALSEQPQIELFDLFNEHLHRLETITPTPDNLSDQRLILSDQRLIIAYLVQAIFHLLAVSGVAPQVQNCCLTRQAIEPNFHDPDWRIEFDISGGGIISNFINVAELVNLKTITAGGYFKYGKNQVVNPLLTANELAIFQLLALPKLELTTIQSHQHLIHWVNVEKVFRKYIQHHFNYIVRSAPMIDTYLSLQ